MRSHHLFSARKSVRNRFRSRTGSPVSASVKLGELTDAALLEDIIGRAFLFFWNEASPRTGLVRDRALADGGPDPRRIASIAATGYGLAALCIGQRHRYLPSREIHARVIATLRFLLNRAEQVNGFFYHFLDIETGSRLNRCEVSPIDTTILLCGVLMAREHFPHPEIRELASNIYRRVNWRWMLNGAKHLLRAGHQKLTFVSACWDTYSGVHDVSACRRRTGLRHQPFFLGCVDQTCQGVPRIYLYRR